MISNVERAVKKSLEDAQREGMEKGMEKGIRAVARQMLAEGYDIDSILRCTGLSKEEIEKLKE